MSEAFFKLKRFGWHKLGFSSVIAFFVTFCFLLGYIFAVVAVSSGKGAVFVWAENEVASIISVRSDYSFFMLFLSSFLRFLPFCLISFLFGTSIVGALVIPAICVLFGYINGAVIGTIYFNGDISGIGFTALVLAPAVVLKTYTLVLSCRESVCFSRNVLNNTLPNRVPDNLNSPFKLYCIRYIFILIFAVAAAASDVAATAIFFGYFDL